MPDDLEQVVAAALRVIREAGVRFVVFGGWGVAAYGHLRGTADVDVLVEPGRLDVLEDAYRRSKAVVERKGTFLEVLMPGGEGLPVHLTEAGSEVAREALDGAVTAELAGEAVPVMDPHEIVASKLIAEREDDPERHAKDLGDIQALDRLGHINRRRLLALLHKRAGPECGERHYRRFLDLTGRSR